MIPVDFNLLGYYKCFEAWQCLRLQGKHSKSSSSSSSSSYCTWTAGISKTTE